MVSARSFRLLALLACGLLPALGPAAPGLAAQQTTTRSIYHGHGTSRPVRVGAHGLGPVAPADRGSRLGRHPRLRRVGAGSVRRMAPASVGALKTGSSPVGELSTARRYFHPLQVSPPCTTGVDGWSCADIGNPGVAGSQSCCWNISGSGVFGAASSDQMHFVYQPVTGDVSIATWFGGTAASTCTSGLCPSMAGVMIRESLDPEAPFICMCLQPGQDSGGRYYNFNECYRSTYGGPAVCDYLQGWYMSVQVCLIAAREGDEYTVNYAFNSGCAARTPTFGGFLPPISMGTHALAGGMVSSGTSSTLETGYFDIFTVKNPQGSPGSQNGGGSPSEPPTSCNATANPVNCDTGDFWHTFSDVSIPGRGIPINLTHTYNSANAAQDSPLGFGWSNPYDMYLSTDANGNPIVHEEAGSTVTPGNPGVLGSLAANSDGTYTFTRYQSQQQYVFASPSQGGQLLREVDRNGYTTTLNYSGSQLTSVTDPEGRSLIFHYDPVTNRVSSISDPAGRSVSFTYDSAGNLTDYLDVAGGHWHFTYDANHLLLTMEDPRQYALNGPSPLARWSRTCTTRRTASRRRPTQWDVKRSSRTRGRPTIRPRPSPTRMET